MASPPSSPPSEGEIVESGSEKATTAINSSKSSNIDRPFRNRLTVSRSPSPVPSPRHDRSRTTSRSPYREARGVKRAHDARDDYYDRFKGDPRDFKVRYESSTSANKSLESRPYSITDRHSGRDRNHNYGDRDSSGRPKEKKPRIRDASPRHMKTYRTNHRQSISRDQLERDQRQGRQDRQQGESTRLSAKQSVSDRGHSPVATAQMKQEAEYLKHQTQHQNHTFEHQDLLTANSPSATSGGDVMQSQSVQPIDEVSAIEERRKRREAIKAKHRGQATPILVEALAIRNDSLPPTPKQNNTEGENHQPESGQSSPPANSKDGTGQDSPTDLVILEDADLANNTTSATMPMHEDEPSAADYDPTMDMQEDKLRHDQHQRKDEMSSEAYDETKVTDQEVLLPRDQSLQAMEKKVADGFDMFADNDDLDMFAEASNVDQKPHKEVAEAAPLPQAKALDMSMLDDWDDPEGYYKVILGELLDNRYHIKSNLGKGMFSGVVRAIDQKTNNLVAIKLIRNNETMKKAGLKEIEILQKLTHADPEDKKHLIRLERCFEHKGHLCMVFENLSINLREVLRKFGRDVGINLKAVRAYAQQMFMGLGLLRKCNILHADLKPDNVLVNESRNVLKICDLGSASDASENEITQYLVSRFYRAPEIILGMPYDFGIDVWSIGCTLFELFTGKILFTGRSNNQMLRAIMECRGKFSHKVLRKAQFASFHFDDLLNFRSVEKDKLTGKDTVRILNYNKPVRDLKARLMVNAKGMSDAEVKELQSFVDLLERCLNLNPEKRCTPAEALRHPFITRVKT